MRYIALLFSLGFMLAACGGANTLRDADAVQMGDTLWQVDFAGEVPFETGSGQEISGRTVLSGAGYALQLNADLKIYGGDAQEESLEVSGRPQNGYTGQVFGVMCRVDENGLGYAFLVDEAGRGAIASLTANGLDYLLDFTPTDANPIQEVKAICSDDALRLWVNDEFVGEATDTTHPALSQTTRVGGILLEDNASLAKLPEAVQVVDLTEKDRFEQGFYRYLETALRVQNGSYHVNLHGNRAAYIWAVGGAPEQNIAVEVEALALSEFEDNLFGVMCRVNPQGEGYAFLLSSDGFGAIVRADGRSLSFIRDWVQNDAIAPGALLRGVCIDDYLALYVDDTLITDVQDSRYPAGGQVGLLAGVFVESAQLRGEVLAQFDDLTVREAKLAD